MSSWSATSWAETRGVLHPGRNSIGFHAGEAIDREADVEWEIDWDAKFQQTALTLYSEHDVCDSNKAIICCDRNQTDIRVSKMPGPRFELGNVPDENQFPLRLSLVIKQVADPPLPTSPSARAAANGDRGWMMRSSSLKNVKRRKTSEDFSTNDFSHCKMCNGECEDPAVAPFSQDRNVRVRICPPCYKTIGKNCVLCSNTLLQPWRSGLCDDCRAQLPQCKACAKRLQVNEVKFKTGLCDKCYNSCSKTCNRCNHPIKLGQLGWCTGVCNDCFDELEKTCRNCQKGISLNEWGWRTGLCNDCYDTRGKCTGKKSRKFGSTGLCDGCFGNTDKSCAVCLLDIPTPELHWSTGLCDVCYNDSAKNCKDCKKHIPLRQVRWGSGLCDDCYNKNMQGCRMCNVAISRKDLHHGIRLCNGCFDKLSESEKACTSCGQSIDVGAGSWGMRLCKKCWRYEFPNRHKIRLMSLDRVFQNPQISQFSTSAPLVYSDKAIAFARLYEAACSTPQSQASQSNWKFTWRSAWMTFVFASFGCSGWFASNAVFGALPLLVHAVPEGAALGSLVNSCTQLGTVLAILYYVIDSSEDQDEAQQQVSEHVTRLRRIRSKRQAASRSGNALHVGQALASLGMLGFAAAWQWRKETMWIVMLSMFTGAVGNVADITVWPLVLMYDKWYSKALLAGASLSGVFANFLEAAIGKFGVPVYFSVAGGLQIGMWLLATYIVGRPALLNGDIVGMRSGPCICTGCKKCQIEGGGLKSPPVAVLSESLLPHDDFTKSASSDDAPTRWLSDQKSIQAIGKHLRTFGKLIVPDGVEEDKSSVRSFQRGSFVVKAVRYSVPSLLPFVAEIYPGAAQQTVLLQYMLTMYNVGDVLGRAFGNVLPGHCALISMWLSSAFFVICTICPSTVASVIPHGLGQFLLPASVFLFNYATGSYLTGLFMQAREATDNPESLQARMSFFGQLGCVSGNALVFLSVSLVNMWQTHTSLSP